MAVYFVLLYNKERVKKRLKSSFGETAGLKYYFILEKLVGFMLMGLVPYLLFVQFNIGGASDLTGIRPSVSSATLYYTAITGILILIINFIRAGKPANYQNYPQIRIREWNPATIVLYNMGWILYLLGYEFLFRGLLFFSALEVFPLWICIGLNAVLYALAHLPKGKFETLGSLPFGVVLCLITWQTGDFLVCFIIHVILAVSNSMIALRANPEMEVKIFTAKK